MVQKVQLADPLAAPSRLLGEDRGRSEVSEDLDAPLSDEEPDGFGGCCSCSAGATA